jgi:SlyX protein
MQEDSRLIELEMKLAHAEKSVEDLSDVVYKQQMQIDNLEKIFILLSKRIQNYSNGEAEIGPANEKPPHY